MKKLKTNDVLIRKFKNEDIDYVSKCFNSSHEIPYLSNININVDMIATQKIVMSALINCNIEEPIWALEHRETKDIFGFVRVDNFSPKNKICKISWGMINNNKNEKQMVQALNRIMKYLFEKRDIELIECSYYEQNKETGDVLDNAGMKKEAVLKQRRYNEKTKSREDFIIYSININDYNLNRKAIAS